MTVESNWGIGFGFGFTTTFGWLVYLLWFWFRDSQVKTALTMVNYIPRFKFVYKMQCFHRFLRPKKKGTKSFGTKFVWNFERVCFYWIKNHWNKVYFAPIYYPVISLVNPSISVVVNRAYVLDWINVEQWEKGVHLALKSVFTSVNGINKWFAWKFN